MLKGKKVIAMMILISIIGIMGNSIIVFADEPITSSASDYIRSTSVNIVAESNEKLKIEAVLGATKTVEKLGFDYVKIQRYTDGNWKTIETLDSNVYIYNRSTVAYATTYYGIAGEQYRALVNFYVEDKGGSDSKLVDCNGVTVKK